MIDLPLTHIRPDEIGVSVEKLRELGYEKDTFGNDLANPAQVVELRPQDILLSESCAEYLVKTAQFMDDLLVKVYGLPPFYNITAKEGLLGHLVSGHAPTHDRRSTCPVQSLSRSNVG
jgi:DNA polymerase II large subunit